MRDTIGMGRRFASCWISGPLVGTKQIVWPDARVLRVMDHGRELGRYVRSNIGWAWNEVAP